MPPLAFPTLHLPTNSPSPCLLPLRRVSSSFPSLFHRPLSTTTSSHHRLPTPLATSNSNQPDPPLASEAEIEMLPGRDGVFSARLPSVVILWDLDNKPPLGPPFDAAASLKRTSSLLGQVGGFSAYANRHAFSHVPGWVKSERSDRRRLDLLEKKGLATPTDPYTCGMCGRKFTTRVELKRHFQQLHERERMKKVNRMRSLKGKKKQKFRDRYISGNHKYDETARELLTPKSGYGLASELRRAGVNVQTVKDKPQAADAALKKRVRESLARGVDWMVLVSDDSDFIETIQMAREAELRTVVVGDAQRALGRIADIWLPWSQVEKGEITDNLLKSKMQGGSFDKEESEEEDDEVGPFMGSWVFDEGEESDDFDVVVEEITGGRSQRRRKGRGRKSAFSEEEGSYEEFSVEDFDEGVLDMFNSLMVGDETFWDGDEEHWHA
ncbi:hypothetical protein LUZ63_007057 [Rhynchospora breviuscula]|uniref:C2H2-type domain-containing protein n=1 Tax=Rhynchospora breviuscula TaxID=2022672 RepID=A0A9Q0CR06_9POAL|nr:hypothetical protein LUZ63_007057 [Rhynchospora breviuscula]